jgi:5-amino-6-(5-phosphoribosylamino)uracil reductase
MIDRPHTTVILAMTADGKIADRHRSAARFGSTQDKAHLETQVAQADAVIFGAETLRAYGTTMSVRQPELLAQRQAKGQSPQPIQIVCAPSGSLDRQARFFQQPVPRWLMTKPDQAHEWGKPEFDRVIAIDLPIDWASVLHIWKREGVDRLAILGGGKLVASFFEQGLVDELYLTICPVIFGGDDAPTPFGGMGFDAIDAPRLKLLGCESIGDEIFLHYRATGDG